MENMEGTFGILGKCKNFLLNLVLAIILYNVFHYLDLISFCIRMIKKLLRGRIDNIDSLFNRNSNHTFLWLLGEKVKSRITI